MSSKHEWCSWMWWNARTGQVKVKKNLELHKIEQVEADKLNQMLESGDPELLDLALTIIDEWPPIRKNILWKTD